MRYKALLAFAFGLALAGLSNSAQAVQYRIIYGIDTTTFDTINKIIAFDRWDSGGSATWAFDTGGFPGVHTFGNPFLFDQPVNDSWLIGLTSQEDGEHVVLTMTSTGAASAAGMGWDNVFADFSEADILQAIHDTTSGAPFGEGIVEHGLEVLGQFHDEYADMLFTPVNGVGNAVKFSDGTIIGTTHFEQETVVPEPASMAVLGVGALALVRRRRRK